MTTPTDREIIDYIAVEAMGYTIACDCLYNDSACEDEHFVMTCDQFKPLTDANHAYMVIAKCYEVMDRKQKHMVSTYLSSDWQDGQWWWTVKYRDIIEAIYAVMAADRKGEV